MLSPPPSPSRRPLLQPGLHPLPDGGVNDRRMLPRMGAVPVPDAPGIEGVGEEMVDVPPVEGLPAGGSAVGLRPKTRAEVETLGLLHRPHGAELLVERVEPAHRGRLVLPDPERPPLRLVSEGHVASHPEALPLGRRDLVPDALGV